MEEKTVSVARDLLPYATSWFMEEVDQGTKQINLFMFVVAGLHEFYLKGIRHVRCKLLNAEGSSPDSTMIDLDQDIDTLSGPIALSTDWGTLDVIGYWNETEKKPIRLARIFLRKPAVD